MGTAIWKPVSESGHPLAQLEGKPLGETTLEIDLGPKTRFGADYFQIHLRCEGSKPINPLLLALYNAGPYPSFNWIEVIKLNSIIQFAEKEFILREPYLETLFQYLSSLVSSGGHIMVEYDSEDWLESRLALECGIPPVATPLGNLLYRAGCGVAFKDWYFAEGGSEGPRKLQGNKALNEEHRRTRAKEMMAEMRSFLAREPHPECEHIWEAARQRAEETLSNLSTNASSTHL